MSASRLALFVLIALLAVGGYQAVVLGMSLWRGRSLAAESSPFERRFSNASGRLLVLGDSTAVGTGGSAPADSVAGRLATDLPRLEVLNMAEDGARTADLIGQLHAAPEGRFDVILIQVGGNDILRFTDLDKLRTVTAELLRSAQDRSSLVVMMSTGDVGTAPAFRFPITRLLSARTQSVRALFRDLAGVAGIEYVDLYRPPEMDPFLEDPDRFYASDGLHPSSEGYRLWYEHLREDSSIIRRLGLEDPAADEDLSSGAKGPDGRGAAEGVYQGSWNG